MSTPRTDSVPVTAAPGRAGRRQWAALVVLMLPVLLVSIDNTVLSFAMPSIARDLEPSGAAQLWIIDAYPLVLAGLLVAMGNMGDRYGRRRLLMIGAAGFGLVSALAAFATDASQLIAARAALGFFGAMLMPSTLSLLRSIFTDRKQRRLAIAIWASGFSGGSALGPLVGGVLLEHFWWGSVFLVAVPVLLPLLVLTPVLVPESKDPAPGPIDVVAILLSLATVAPIVYAIKTFATEGVTPLAIAAPVVGVLAGILFVRRMARARNPMLDVGLFREPVFTGAVLVNLLSVVSLVGFLFFVTQHLQLVAGLDPLAAGFALIPGSVVVIVSGLVIVPIVARARPSKVVAIALAFSAAAYVILAVTGQGASVGLLVLAFCLLGAGIGASQTISNDLIIAAVPPAKAGAASAVSETAYEVGAVLGTAVLGSILTASYRTGLVLPAGLSEGDASAARETLGGAVSVAGRVPSDVGAALLESAHTAFDGGVVTTSIIGAVLMVGAIVISLTSLRRASSHD
ncbi:MFS transporter [Clavibacter michiganensis]|uniref:MFS transporter n=1 Tax=Clavibacter michiganensis TaxID=28447 RepID=UPI0005B78650|nr:MFS transporter [Clavibacter michiganensis]